MQPDTTAGREVTLVDVPVALYRDVQQHTDAVLRELVLMAEYEASRDEHGPMRRLFHRANDGFADRLDLTVRAAAEIDQALRRGDEAVTLTFRLPERFAQSVQAWTALLRELDVLCRDGTMLSVPASPNVARFLQWWCDELCRQLRDGAQPTPWPAYAARVDELTA